MVNTDLSGGLAAPGGVVAPAARVVTSWAIRTLGSSEANDTVRLRVVGGNTAIASGIARPAPTASGVVAYPERLPIGPGQGIGLESDSSDGDVSVSAVSTGAGALSIWLLPFADGATRPPDSSGPGAHAVFQATIEPDADSDGFGDETQDGCLGVGGPRGGCPDPPAAPETQIDSGPSGKITKRKATFAFSSPVAGATFECALDKDGFSPCASPKKLKRLAPGKHRFRVRAISPEGMVDRSPAERSFKRKRR
jgi:hypothetical protein